MNCCDTTSDSTFKLSEAEKRITLQIKKLSGDRCGCYKKIFSDLFLRYYNNIIVYFIKLSFNIANDLNYFKLSLINRGQSWRSGTRCDCKTDWLWVRSPLEEMKYLLKFIFPFLRSSVEVSRSVEFCHSTRNASRIRQKVGNGVS